MGVTARPHPARKLNRSGWSPASTSTAGKLVESAGQILIVVLLASSLGPRDYGPFALVLALVTAISSSLSLSGPALATRFLPAVGAPSRLAMARRLTARLGKWRAIEAAALTAATIVLVAIDSSVFPALICGLAALALSLDLAATLLFQIGLGLGRVTMFSFRFAAQNMATVAAALPLYAAWGVDGAVAAIALSAALMLTWGALTVGRALTAAPAEADVELDVPPTVWRFGVYQVLGGLLVAVVHRGGLVATALLAGAAAQTGYAAVAIGVAISATYFVAQAFAVNFPRLAARWKDSPQAIEREVVAFAGRALAIAGAGAMVAALLVRPALPVIFGARFRGATDAVIVALAVLPLAPVTALLSQVAALRLANRQLLLSRGAGAVAFIAVAAFTVPRWGALGASIAVLAGGAVTLISSAVGLTLPGAARLTVLAVAESAVVILIGQSA